LAESNKKSELGRLEDFIELAKKGKPIKVEIELRKQSIIQKVDIDGTGDRSSEIETYLLIADYTFKFNGKTHKISKVYMFAATTESRDIARDIANARLQVDYERLSFAHIPFSKKFF
jgi:hypothetical protein